MVLYLFKMEAFFLVRLACLYIKLISVVGTFQLASFSKTTILDNTCQISRQLSDIYQPRLFDCARVCTDNTECRLYLYCSQTASCRLYQDGTQCVKSGDSSDCSCYKKNYGYKNNTYHCPLGYYGDKCQDIYKDCSDAFVNGVEYDVVLTVTIKPHALSAPFDVICYLKYTGWMSILDRNIDCVQETFNRTLIDYEEGFGAIVKNRWLGFNKLLTVLALPGTFVLQVNLYYSDTKCKSHYKDFGVGNVNYTFYTSEYSVIGGAVCGDSMTNVYNLSGRPFSTFDDDHTTDGCAGSHGGGWWFSDDDGCSNSFLMGSMDGSGIDNFWRQDLGGTTITQAILRIQRKN